VADSVLKRGGTPILFALLTDSKELIRAASADDDGLWFGSPRIYSILLATAAAKTAVD